MMDKRVRMSGPIERGWVTFARRAFRALASGRFWEKLQRHLFGLKIVAVPLDLMMRLVTRIHPGKVVCVTFSGAIEGSPAAIADALRRKAIADPIHLVRGDCLPSVERRGLMKARMWSLASLYHIATAEVLIDDAQMLVSPGIPSKRPGQFYLNTWHGSLGIKRLSTANRQILKRIERAARATDLVLTNSVFEEEVFRASVFPRTPFLKIGHPRNDVFFLPPDVRTSMRDRVRAELGLSKDEHFALYGPTFRESSFFTQADGLDFTKWARAFEDRFGGRWRICLRLHPHDAQALAEGLFSLPENVQDLSSWADVQELLIAADAGITDYSSWIFDYLLGGGPGFIFAPDKAKYDAARGFCYPLEETPFPIAQDEASLCANIRGFDAVRYAAATKSFLARRGCYERGDAAARAVDAIERGLRLGDET